VAFVVTVALVNLPLTQQLLGFAPLGWRAQVAIEAYSVLYLIVADLLRGSFDSYQAAQRKALLGRRHAGRRPGIH
jgi:hypothetical protein